MTSKPWKLVLLLLAIFLAGGVTGALVMKRFGRKMITDRPMPDQWAPLHMRRLVERLELQPEQVEQLRPIVRRNLEELGRLRNQSMGETKAVFERMEREIAEKLTPEQRVKFEELNRQMRERARKFMPNKPNRPRPEAGHSDGKRPPAPEDPPPEAGK
jgi:uncharacterized membrane protein